MKNIILEHVQCRFWLLKIVFIFGILVQHNGHIARMVNDALKYDSVASKGCQK